MLWEPGLDRVAVELDLHLSINEETFWDFLFLLSCSQLGTD